MSDSVIQTFRAPAASNYATSVGLVVNLTAVATGQARATLLTGASDDTLSNAVLGVIVAADNANGGAVSVCTSGPCRAMAGAAITPGTDVFLMVDGNSKVIPATDGNMTVGRFLGKQVAASGDFIEIFVQPGNLENT